MKSAMVLDSILAKNKVADIDASTTDMGNSLRLLFGRHPKAFVKFPMLRDLAGIVADASIPACVKSYAINDIADRMMTMVVRDMAGAKSAYDCAYRCSAAGCTSPSGLYSAMSDLALLATCYL